MLRPEPGATAQVLVSSDYKNAQIYWGGFKADFSVCVTNQRTAVKSCGNGYVTTRDVGELAAGDALQLECPISTVYAKVVNSCPVDNPAIFGVSREADWIILRAGDSFDFNVPVEDASSTFTPLGGYRMCASSTLGTTTACGTDLFQLTGIADQDTVQLACPDSPPAPADMSRTIPLGIYTGPSCPNLLVQIGCEGTYCQGLAYVEGSQNLALLYPMVSPAARLQVRIFRPAYSSVNWTVSFSGGDPTFLDQANSQWLKIPVPDDATQVSLRTSCTLEAPTISVFVVNSCQYTTITVTSPAQNPISLRPYAGLVFTTYQDFLRLSFESADGRILCGSSRGGASSLCAASFTVNNLVNYDAYELRCDT